MSRHPRGALPHALMSAAALASVSLAASLMPVLMNGADAVTPAGSAVAAAGRQSEQCTALKTAKKRKKCRQDAKRKVKPTPSAAATQSATTKPSTAVTISSLPSIAPSSPTPSVVPPLAPTATAASTGVVTPSSGSEAVVPMKPISEIFGINSEWTRDISTAPLAPDSGALVANLTNQVTSRYNGVAAFNVWNYNVATYTVPAGQPRVNVTWDDCQGKGYTPSQVYSAAGGAHFKSVPIPDDAVPAAGSDAELSIYSPSSDQLWEFWVTHKSSDGWHACWGGRIDRVSQSKGYFNDGTGVAATGLSMTAGAIGVQEAQVLSIKHAMSLNVVDAANWSQYSYPAQRSDGNLPAGTSGAIQEGQRFRLDPTVNVNSLNLTPVARAIAVAAQKYGFIVNDRAGAVSVIAESGSGAAARGGPNPWSAILNGTASYNVMANFPWAKMQALPLNYGR